MRRVTGIFGGEPRPPAGGNPDSNTLISDMATVICLDDYHSLDRKGRKEKAVTALAPEAQNFDLMFEQVRRMFQTQSGSSAAHACWFAAVLLGGLQADTRWPRCPGAPRGHML